MKIGKFYKQIVGLKTSKNLDKPAGVNSLLDYITKGISELSVNNDYNCHYCDINCLVNKYNFYVTPNLFRDIEFQPKLSMEGNLIIFASYEMDYICLDESTKKITYNEFGTYSQMALCASSLENFLDVLWEAAIYSIDQALGKPLNTAILVNKLSDLSGTKNSIGFYKMLLGVP